MATLTGNAIQTSYQGLIKTTDNAGLGAAEKAITDGVGTASTLSMSTTSASFTGTLDLSGATVTGLPVDPNTTYDLTSAQAGTDIDIDLTGSDATIDKVKVEAGTNITLTKSAQGFVIDAAGGGGAAGLVTGGQTDSMKSASTLTTNPATTLGTADIALGDNATVTFTSATNDYYDGGAIVMGDNANFNKQVDYSFAPSVGGVVIGHNAYGNVTSITPATAIGPWARAERSGTIAIGAGKNTGSAAKASGDQSIAIGENTEATNSQAVAIGTANDSQGYGTVSIGGNAQATQGGFQTGGIAIGNYAKANATGATVVGTNSRGDKNNVTVLGHDNTITTAGAERAIVIGYGNEYSGANHRVIHIGNQIIQSTTSGTNDTVRIGNSLEVEGGGTSTNDISNSVQIGLLSKLGSSNTVAIGRQANANAQGGCAVGRNSTVTGENGFAGPNSTAAQSASAAFNGVTSVNANHTAVANLEVIGNGNGIKLTSPNGTTYTVTVSDAGALVVA